MDLKQKYKQYLKSNDWKQKRKAKLARKSRCAICHETKYLHVHHLQYRRWYDVKMSDLRVLCSRCHDTAHRLMDEGVLVIKPGMNHHGRFAVTKNAVVKALGIQNFASWLNRCEAEPSEDDRLLAWFDATHRGS